ncbi:MAG: hypothetical protein M1815_006194 [Lichina confinis]|nr:MAG: hypothetical protein M1815_006194 [Lichina confinis]
MHDVPIESTSPGDAEVLPKKNDGESYKQIDEVSSSLPFGRHIPFAAISGPVYVTAQVLVQQTAYALSDKIFTYTPERFDLDTALLHWSEQDVKNVHGYAPGLSPMQIRAGAGSIALGYMFSRDFDLKKRHVPQSLIASSAALRFLRPALDQLSLLYNVASPLVAHVAAVDYTGGAANTLNLDYASALGLADELGLGLVCSFSTHESQHMALFSTLLSRVLPTVHIYDGVVAGRETTRVIDTLDATALHQTYVAVSNDVPGTGHGRESPEGNLRRLLQTFNGELGTAYSLFEYDGHRTPDQVLVVFGTVESRLAASLAQALARAGHKVGVISVRVYRPFAEDEFLGAIPESVQGVTVLGQVSDEQTVADDTVHSILYDDVLAAVTFSNKWRDAPAVADAKYPRDVAWTPARMQAILAKLGGETTSASITAGGAEGPTDGRAVLSHPYIQQLIFWDADDSASASVPSVLSELMASDSYLNVTVGTTYNNVTHGGIRRTDIRTSKKSMEDSYPIEQADIGYVGLGEIFKDINVVESVKPNGILVARLSGVSDADLDKRLPEAVRKLISEKGIKLYLIDPRTSDDFKDQEGYESYITQVAMLKLVRPDVFEAALPRLAKLNGSEGLFRDISSKLDGALREVDIPESWSALPEAEKDSTLHHGLPATSFTPFDKLEHEPPALLRTWQVVAQGLAFKEAYGTEISLRPDLTVKTWTVRVKENRRLTPSTYERNIFHIEFDLGDSGLKYDIGEALGIHAENDEAEVMEFIRYYGLEPEAVVEVPSREDPDLLESRTVYQSLVQNVDIFGRPPKKFYEALAIFAQDDKEQQDLLALAGPMGATEFKRRAEVDTITYADILAEFASARPSFHDLVRIVSPMKRREYSIASSQKVTPNSVALLIVTVDWIDPKGRPRLGQATRFLNKLAVGDAVVVSVKPSVMKLPTTSTQPLIMAGLGTGLAPFRAFVQYRAWQKAQGIDIGSVLLYMGSRHQREEYLYGEEWEAYQDAGVITLLGRAFSRDQPQKIYIQDRMRQTIMDIIEAYVKKTGSFYLCGPTWPVPDVTEVLQEAIALDATIHAKKVDARKEIERLKDDGRYVLEVY